MSDHNVEMVPSESEKLSQALSRARKNESGDINSVKNRERPKWRINRGNKVSGHNFDMCQVRVRNDLKHHHELGKMNPAI